VPVFRRFIKQDLKSFRLEIVNDLLEYIEVLESEAEFTEEQNRDAATAFSNFFRQPKKT